MDGNNISLKKAEQIWLIRAVIMFQYQFQTFLLGRCSVEKKILNTKLKTE